jgi:hypothetical protein
VDPDPIRSLARSAERATHPQAAYTNGGTARGGSHERRERNNNHLPTSAFDQQRKQKQKRTGQSVANELWGLVLVSSFFFLLLPFLGACVSALLFCFWVCLTDPTVHFWGGGGGGVFFPPPLFFFLPPPFLRACLVLSSSSRSVLAPTPLSLSSQVSLSLSLYPLPLPRMPCLPAFPFASDTIPLPSTNQPRGPYRIIPTPYEWGPTLMSANTQTDPPPFFYRAAALRSTTTPNRPICPPLCSCLRIRQRPLVRQASRSTTTHPTPRTTIGFIIF